MRFARLENNIVKEIFEGDSLPEFHPSFVWISDIGDSVSEGWVYDGEDFSSPEDLKTIDEVRIEKIAEVKALRSEKYQSGFVYNEKTFQCDIEAQKDMTAIMVQFLGGATNPHGGAWRASDNESVTMNDSQVQAFIQATFNYVYSVKNTAWTHEENINNLGVKQDILEYNVLSGWP